MRWAEFWRFVPEFTTDQTVGEVRAKVAEYGYITGMEPCLYRGWILCWEPEKVKGCN